MVARRKKPVRNALTAVRSAPHYAPWEPYYDSIFRHPLGADGDWTAPPSIKITHARRTQVATYFARFTRPNGATADVIVKIKLLKEGGGRIIGRQLRVGWVLKGGAK
jgi:hypothetical protein